MPGDQEHVPWRRLGLNAIEESDSSSLKSGVAAVLNVEKRRKKQQSREVILRTNSIHLHVKGHKCFKRLASLNNEFLIDLKHRKEAYQLGQGTKEEHKREAQAAAAEEERSRQKT